MRAAAIAVLMLVFALPSWGAQPRHATVQLTSRAPLTIEGRGFGVGEAVAVTAAAAGTARTIGVTARRNGSFRARFELRLDRCNALVVRAAGSLGSRAVLQVEPGCTARERKSENERKGRRRR